MNNRRPPPQAPPPQQAQQQQSSLLSQLNFAEPPDVQVIEASCKLAETKNETNSRWTNILKEPFLLKKGSQIRCASSFIQMRGMDQEIIQFIPDGQFQDNSHTLLTQLYTVNDGVNGKTTSYDYISHNIFHSSFVLLTAGEDVATGFHNIISETGTGTGLQLNVGSVADGCILTSSIEITNPGVNYRTGDPITFSGGTASTQASGYIIANDAGQIKSVVLTNNGNYQANNIPTISVSTATGGSGASLTVSRVEFASGKKCLSLTGIVGTGSGINDMGENYQAGDILQIDTGSVKPRIKLLSVGPAGQVLNTTYFDQGYNYGRVPIFRWAQTFDINDTYAFGRNIGDRSFTANNGREISVYNNPPCYEQDLALSCQFNLQNKEDEFCPGVFHQGGQDIAFEIQKPVFTIAGDDASSARNFVLRQIEGLSEILIPNGTRSYVDSYGKTISLKTNPINQFTLGMVFTLNFSAKNFGQIPDVTTFQDVQNNLQRKFGGVYSIGQISTYDAEISIDGDLFTDGYMVMRLGTAQQFEGAQMGRYAGNTEFNQPQIGFPDIYNLSYSGTITGGTPNQLYNATVTNGVRDDGYPITGVGLVVRVQLDGAGTSWASFGTASGGSGYRQGDILYLNNPDGSQSTIKIYILGIDGIGGITFPCEMGTQLSKQALNQNGDVIQLNIAPFPMNIIGIGNVINRPANNLYDLNWNAVGCIRSADKDAGTQYDNYPNFPTKWEELGLQPTNTITNGGYQDSYAHCGLFKGNGDSFRREQLTTNFANHSQETKLTVLGSNYGGYGGFSQITLTAGFDAVASQIYLGATNPMPTNVFFIQVLKTAWAITDYSELPNNYCILNYLNADLEPTEEHVYIWFIDHTTDPNHFTIYFRARNIQQTRMPMCLNSVFNFSDFYTYRGNVPQNFRIGPGAFTLKWISNPAEFQNKIQVKWGDGSVLSDYTGTIGFTSDTNFYSIYDQNYTALQESEDWKNILNTQLVDPLVLRSYQNGGNYFLSNNNQMLLSPDGENLDTYRYDGSLGFSLGMGEYPIGNLTSPNNPNNIVQTDINTSAITDAQRVYAYEPYLRQKTFKIPQNFSTPSAIGAWWTRESHLLSDALDMATGDVLIDKENSGLLQNEFCMPVYGSNNMILNNGRYNPDFDLFPDSQGLEPGHCIGRSGVDRYSDFLATNILNVLPQDDFDNSFFNVFFRTFNTIVRNYDPLKVSSNAPDRTPLKTVNTQAGNVGNTNDSGVTPPISGRTTLDGTPLIDIKTPTPPSGGGTVPPSAESQYKMYELGNPNPTAADQPYYFPGSSTEYPVRYIENNNAGDYDRAKASNFVGANNLTLAYQQDLSTFAFQFFYQSYTTPFVDNTGGDLAVRIFYGNRKAGVYNHDAFGGVSVVNWCRPDYPRNIFTFNEINQNLPTSFYSNGLSPLTGVAPIGLRFMNKLGYTNSDLNITYDPVSKISTVNKNLMGIQQANWVDEITIDNGDSVEFQSYNNLIYGTNYAEIDSSDSILSSIPPPESGPGLNSHVVRTTPNHGTSNKIINRWGDYIFYPYSINANTNTFNSKAQVEYNNCGDTYGSVGGLNLTSGTQLRGMGLPNTTGSTTIVSQTTVPVSLNPDCNIYLSYTIQANNSTLFKASELPIKLNHGHMIVLSSLIQKPNYQLNDQGRLPGISIVNKTFLQGDYILSMGQLTFYAYKDQYISQITTEIVNNDYTVPAGLGDQSTVIYEITNFSPTPAIPPSTIFQKQQAGYLINAQMAEMAQKQDQGGKPSKMASLLGDLRNLGMETLDSGTEDNSSIINQLGSYIRSYDLLNLSPHERQQFYASDVGQQFTQRARQLMLLSQNFDIINQPGGPTSDIIQELARMGDLPMVADPSVGFEPEDFGDEGSYVFGGASLAPDPLQQAIEQGLQVPPELFGQDIANPLSFMTHEIFQRDYGGDINRYWTHLIGEGFAAQGFGAPAQVPPGIQNLDLQLVRGAASGGLAVDPESGIGTSIQTSQPPPSAPSLPGQVPEDPE